MKTPSMFSCKKTYLTIDEVIIANLFMKLFWTKEHKCKVTNQPQQQVTKVCPHK